MEKAASPDGRITGTTKAEAQQKPRSEQKPSIKPLNAFPNSCAITT
jgi:hypothetical protein